MTKQNPDLYGADKLEFDMFAAGYVRSPNNIHGLPSVHWKESDPLKGASPLWYAGGPGLPEPESDCEVQVCMDRIRVFTTKLMGDPDYRHRRSFYDQVTIAVFETVSEFLEWCRSQGRVSESGAPAYSAGID